NFRRNKKLTFIGTWGAQVSAAGLEPFRDCPALHSIFLGESRFGDEDMAFFARFPALPKLTALLLTNCPVTDQGLSHLEGARLLMHVHLDGTRVADAVMRRLQGFPKLNQLILDRTAVGDVGLNHLQKCAGLTNLSLLKTNVTAEGVAGFHRA